MKIKNGYQLPKPDGRYKVGTSAREYSFILGDGTVRSIPCRVYYPTDLSADSYAFHAYGNNLELTSRIKTNSYECIPVAQGNFPLVVFNHGMGLCVESHTILMEELASHGYIILGINHEALPVCEESTARNYTSKEAFYALPDYAQWIASNTTVSDIYLHKARYRKVVDAAPDTVKSNKLWRQDCHVAVDGFLWESKKAETLFFQHIDDSKIAAVGMSFGGACAMGLAQECSQYKAVVNLDGVFYSETWETPLLVPALFINGDSTVSGDHLRFQYLNANNDAYHISLAGCEHMNFTDWGNILDENPIILENDGTQEVESKTLGDADPEVLTQTINLFVLSFLNKYLKGTSAPILDNNGEIPGAKVLRKQGNIQLN